MRTNISKIRLLGAFVFILLMVITVSGPLSAQPQCTKNILILHSYNHDSEWTHDQHKGIKRAFNEAELEYQLFVEHMDWKNFHEEELLSIIKKLVYHKYSKNKIDLVIATDDAALEFVLENREDIFPGVPVVFSGISRDSFMRLTVGSSNIKGVFENLDPIGTLKAAQILDPRIKNVFYVHDGTESGAASFLTVHNAAYSLGLNIIDSGNYSSSDIFEKISQLDDTFIVLMGSYTVGANGTVHVPEQVVRRISDISPVPVYHLYDFMYQYGTVGGSLIRGENQGYQAGLIAVRILQGEDINSIPFYDGKTTELIFDYQQMARHNFSMELLPTGSTVENKPFSFYEAYKDLVQKTVALIVVLLTLIGLQITNISKRKIVEKELRDKNEELSQIYEEISASEEELRTNYNELLCNQQQLKESQQKYKEQELIIRKMAYYDALTGLPNRAFLLEEVTIAITKTVGSNEKAGLIFVDINNFKNINDTFGHIFGDKVLRMAAFRITSRSGGSEITVARLGGDEFVILICGDKQMIIDQAERVLNVFRNPMSIEQHLIHLTVSAGISFAPEHGTSFDELIKCADTAMYKAKAKGKGNYLIFDKTMEDELLEKITIERGLREALEKGDFIIHYQPQVNLRKRRVVGFEALVRWRHPEWGIIDPGRFISIAEESGLIIPLGIWVLREACKYMLELHKAGYNYLRISVNISVVQIMQNDFLSKVEGVLEETGIPPKFLELEITESLLMESLAENISKVKSLQAMGIRIALDDFGKGYSSLTYLKQFPINTLKIDKSFVEDITNNFYAMAIAGNIVRMAHVLGLEITAEGVETEDQVDYFINQNCDMIQGYIVSKPLPPEELIEFLNNFDTNNFTKY